MKMTRHFALLLTAASLFAGNVMASSDFERGERSEFAGKQYQGAQDRLGRLHDALKLTDKQESAWEKFVETTKPERKERPDQKGMSELTTPERLEKHADMMMERAKQAKERAKHADTFYAVLNNEQKKTFDDFFDEMRQNRMDKRGGKPPRGENSHGEASGRH